MTADTLDEAIDIVNEIDYGLTSGLHSLDRGEIDRWLSRIEAGNLYVNRGITGAIVRRQPFGGWKKSAIGAGTKAGGPSYLMGLVDWQDAPVSEPGAGKPAILATGAVVPAVQPLLTAVRATADAMWASNADVAWFEAAIASDAAAWHGEFGVARDVSALGVERNVLRYLPVPVTIRVTADAPSVEAAREIAAGLAAGATLTVSSENPLPAELVHAITGGAPASAAHANSVHALTVRTEPAAVWHARVARLAEATGPHAGARIRLVAGPSRATAAAAIFAAAAGKPDIAVYAGNTVSAGRVELLPYLREQAVSITAHRFGTPNRLTEGLV